MLERNSLIRCCYLVGFLDLFAVGMLFPLFNRRGRELGASPSLLGVIGSIYGGLQMISSPYMGKASDMWGRKPVLLLSILGCIAGYLTSGLADTILLFALAKFPTGILKHSQASAKAFLSDITLPEERAGVMGTFSAIGSMGFIIAPVIGGTVAMQENGFFKVSLLTCSVYVFNFIFVCLAFGGKVEQKNATSLIKHLPAEHEIIDKSCDGSRAVPMEPMDGLKERKHSDTKGVKNNSSEKDKEKEDTGLSRFFGVLKIRSVQNVRDLLLIRFVFSFGMIIYRSNYTAMLDYRYGVDAKTTGYLISFGSVAGAISGISVGAIYGYFKSDENMMFCASLLMASSLFGITISPNIYGILFCTVPLALSTAVMRVNSHNLLLKRSQADEKGAVMGVADSITSTARMLSPAIAGFAQEISVAGPSWLSTALAIVGVGLMAVFMHHKKMIDKIEKKD